MRYLASLAVSLAFLSLSAGSALAQDLSPGIQRLDQFVGTWAYDNMDGTTTCDRLAEAIVHCTSDWINADGDPVGAVFLMVYNSLTERYEGYRFYSSGYSDSGAAWFEDGNWVSVFDARNGNKVKQISTVTTDSWTYEWFRSVRGGPWEKTSDGSATKVR